MSDAPKQHMWYYTRQSLLHGGEHGPFTEQQILELATLGKIKLDTLLRSPTKTNDREILAESIPKLAIAINQVEIDAEAKRLADVEQRKKEKTAIAEQKQIAKQEWKTEHERRSKLISEERAVSSHTATTSPPSIGVGVVAKQKRWQLFVGLGCGLPLTLLAMAAIVIFANSIPRRNIPPAFTEFVEVDATTTLTASYGHKTIYIPLNTDYYQCVPYGNRRIEVHIVRNGWSLTPTAGYFDIDGKPTELTCESSDIAIADCSVVNGSSVYIDPKAPGKCTISIGFMGKQVHCNIEFVQIPLRVFDGNDLPQKTKELIEKIGFPDSKKRVYATKSGDTVDGFPHELTGVYEHWRYTKFPKLIIATSSFDDVIGIMTEH
jgi:hypothetical protein